jgi:tryptophan 2,3-dioxygenase
MSSNSNWDQYSEYLHLDKILGAQTPRSWANENTPGAASHDEMLFIIFHQVYELWFKQILFELDDIQKRFDGDIVNDRDLGPVIGQLERIVLILRSIVAQMDILETMNPQSFVDFRESLQTASGFQSWQFRLVEIRLGLKRDDRLKFNYHEYDKQMNAAHRGFFETAENTPTLHDQLDEWLSRTPFIEDNSTRYSFWESYQASVHNMFEQRSAEVKSTNLTPEEKALEIKAINKGRAKFDAILDPDAHAEMLENRQWHMSLKALQSALFINIYRHEPVLQVPFKLLSYLMDIDSLMSKWRYAHALMVQRMVGFSMGSGGSSGYGYLMQTLEKHRIFSDLFSLSGYLIPSNMQPSLPKDISRAMDYRYTRHEKLQKEAS